MEQTMQLERRVRTIPANPRLNQTGSRRKGKLRVAAYCRVSTDSEEQINSYKAQKDYYTQHITENPDWEMAGVFADEGLSGTSLKKRKEFNRMIAACKRGSIDLILTKSLSRFARNTVDCLEAVRTLKEHGIGVIFEKENINTLTESSEFLITLFSGFAQAESESLSKNIIWGKRKSMEDGKVPFQYSKMLGYRKGADGMPEVVPEEAAIIRRIYRSYLSGYSLKQLKDELDADGVPPAIGVKGWSQQVLHNILTNEKYMGDALLQKTYHTDCLDKKVKKNLGDLPMYYVENHHEGIVPKELWRRVQEEMARRNNKRKVLQKSGKTEHGKFSAKYALSERLVCGECGSPYKRCTWARNGKKRVVWRCVSRLEFGTKYCHSSPTLEEETLHSAIRAAMAETFADRDAILAGVQESLRLALGGRTEDGAALIALRQQATDLDTEQAALLQKALESPGTYDSQLKTLMEEKTALRERLRELEQHQAIAATTEARMRELFGLLAQIPASLDTYDDALVRRTVERVTVVDAEAVKVKFADIALEVEQKLC